MTTGCLMSVESLPKLLVAAIVLLGVLLWWTHHSTPLDEIVKVSTEGTFAADGIVPSRLRSPDGARYWSSWQDDDAHTGQLQLGPFTTPPTLGFYAIGYPRLPGNRLFFEHASSGEIWEPALSDPGEAWAPVVVDMPLAWIGQPVVLHAIDGATGVFGWLGLAEPFAASRPASWWTGAARPIGVFVFVGLVLGLAATGASSVCRSLGLTFEPALLLGSCALLALSGYLIFWLTWAHATLGAVAAWLELLAVCGIAFCRGSGTHLIWRSRDWWQPAVLMLGAGMIYVSGLLLYSTDNSMSVVAQTRFAEGGLPVDNVLPQRFAERLMQDLSPKHLVGGWRSSDRPPLQAGWLLLLQRPARALGVDYDTVGQCAGIWFQLLWIPAVWLWLRSLKTPRGAATLIMVGLLPTGYFFLNSSFVWPKLGAAALVLGAFVLWFLMRGGESSCTTRHATGGLLAALGWLAHGGVAFALAALAPFILWSGRERARVRSWLLAGGCFAVLALPWLAYQKWYEPPGNQLVRWHLAGEQTPEKRGTWESLADAYSNTTFRAWSEGRLANARMLFAGEWRSLWTFDFSDAGMRRNSESFLFAALGWWNAGIIAILLSLGIPGLQRRWARDVLASLGVSGGWVLLTVVIWVMLMFVGGTTLIHQGSYTALLVLLPGLALPLWRLHPLSFFAVAGAQACGFGFIWLQAPAHWTNPVIQIDAAVTGAVAAVVCLAVAGEAFVADRRKE